LGAAENRDIYREALYQRLTGLGSLWFLFFIFFIVLLKPRLRFPTVTNFLHKSSYDAAFWVTEKGHTSILVAVQQYLHSVKVFSFSPLCSDPTPHQEFGGVHISREGTQAGQRTQMDQRDIPHHLTSCSAIQQRGGVLGEGSHLLGDWLDIILLERGGK